eukprot:3941577-Rhodomonas_salina.2
MKVYDPMRMAIASPVLIRVYGATRPRLNKEVGRPVTLRAPYAVSGRYVTELAYAAHAGVCYGECGTELAYGATGSVTGGRRLVNDGGHPVASAERVNICMGESVLKSEEEATSTSPVQERQQQRSADPHYARPGTLFPPP